MLARKMLPNGIINQLLFLLIAPVLGLEHGSGLGVFGILAEDQDLVPRTPWPSVSPVPRDLVPSSGF